MLVWRFGAERRQPGRSAHEAKAAAAVAVALAVVGGSRALQGDGALSGIGAATSLLALAAVALYDTLGWWWADRIAALIAATVAAAEAWHTKPRRRAPG